jgi:hypothetical protein
MATILAAVDILPAIDEEGKDIIPPVSLVKGLVTYVLEAQACSFGY